jgi:uncharacterized protein (DUF1800 family)
VKPGGSGGGSGGSATSAAYQLLPWVPSAAQPFDLDMAAHLMRRAGFGASQGELETMVRIGVHRTVDHLLIPSTTGLQAFGSQMLPTGEVLRLPKNLNHQRAQWIYEAATTHFPLKEKMALFFHDHFSVGANSNNVIPMLIPHVNIFRRHGLGKFRDILVEVSRDPAMLYWLDNRINGAGNPASVNENYGREIIELYTMGEGPWYTQSDVSNASRCLAGWSLTALGNYAAGNKFFYNTRFARAGVGAKVVLGRVIPYRSGANQEQDGYDLIDILLAQKETSEYLVRKIWTYFVADRPSASDPVERALWDDIVVELAARWRSVDYDLRALMSMILRSNYFCSSRAIGKLIKNPMEYVIGTLRNLDTPFLGRYELLGYELEQMGMPLLRYGNPAGLDDGQAWIDSQALINRANFVDDLTQVSKTSRFRVDWDPRYELSKYNLTNRDDVVDHYLSKLIRGSVPAAVRDNLLEFMDYYDGTPKQYRPYNGTGLNSNLRAGKVRGLVYLILVLPEYHIN